MIDESFGDELSVTVIATGFSGGENPVVKKRFSVERSSSPFSRGSDSKEDDNIDVPSFLR